jgi:hypothetical protein
MTGQRPAVCALYRRRNKAPRGGPESNKGPPTSTARGRPLGLNIRICELIGPPRLANAADRG